MSKDIYNPITRNTSVHTHGSIWTEFESNKRTNLIGAKQLPRFVNGPYNEMKPVWYKNYITNIYTLLYNH